MESTSSSKGKVQGPSRSIANARNPNAFGQILVTKGNPSRGKGFEVSHFIRRNGSLKSVSRLDVFLPSMRKAAAWVHRRYPDATLVSRRKDHFGHLAALCFECELRDLLPTSRRGGMRSKEKACLAA
jgi:hypothetical protein